MNKKEAIILVLVCIFAVALAVVSVVHMANRPDHPDTSEHQEKDHESNYVPPIYVNIPDVGIVPIG